MNEPTLFLPFTGTYGKAPIITETRLVRDLTMPPVAIAKYDKPAYERLPARSVCAAEFR